MEPQKHQEDYEEEKEETLATPGVIDKYKQAGKIADYVLKKVLEKIVPGGAIVEICAFGDNLIIEELKKVYTKSTMEKGIAFPVCLSVNEICGHYSPLVSDSEDKEKELSKIKEGDVVKVDLGVHIDGYMALVAFTKVAQADPTKQVDGKKADVILAAYNALQTALRMLKPGKKNNDVTPLINTVSQSYKCNPLEGVLSHELKKHLIDGNNVIINKESFDQKVEEHEFNVNEVYALDIFVSTGEGKPKESELRTTVYKRAIERTYQLKTNHGRAFFRILTQDYPSLCFSIRAFKDEITSKLGVSECLKHDLLNPYPVLLEKPGEFVAHFKVTALLLQGGTTIITNSPLELELAHYKSECQITDQAVVDLLKVGMDKNAQKKEKKMQKKVQAAQQDKKGEEEKEQKQEAKKD